MDRALGYRPGLDGIRALAIGLVLLNHTGLSVFVGGGNGVIVFFVLSGFLITKLMIEEWGRTDRISLGGFYGRRAVRILPAPTVMLLVLLVAGPWITDTVAQQHDLWREILLSATYTMNMRPLLLGDHLAPGIPDDGFLGHMWSLAVEEQFYLVWPVTMITLALPRRGARRVVEGLLCVATTVVAVRFALYYLPALDPDVASIAFFSFDGFALGAALAFALHHGTFPSFEHLLASPTVPIVGAVVLLGDLVLGRYTHQLSSLYVVYSSVAAAAIVGHVFVAPTSSISRLASVPAGVRIGKLSYSIYLWHNPIWVFVSSKRFPGTPLVVLTLGEWALTAVAVLASYHLVERPAMRWRARFAH